MSYHDELSKAMVLLSQQPRAFFVGQGVGVPGTSMHSTLTDVPQEQRIEFPVAEELQMGYCIGRALVGDLPICIFPRWNFVLRAADQIINHLDRLPIYSDGQYKPKIIIRTAVPSKEPFNPGPQHDDDFTLPFRLMCRTIYVVQLVTPESVLTAYKHALKRPGSTILVEMTEHYKDERGKDRSAT